jgi:hypothetical protein
MHLGDTLSFAIERLVSRGKISTLATECRAELLVAEDVVAGIVRWEHTLFSQIE